MSELTEIANQVNLYKEQYENGEITQKEYCDLLESLNLYENLANTAHNLDIDIKAREIILDAIEIAKIVK